MRVGSSDCYLIEHPRLIELISPKLAINFTFILIILYLYNKFSKKNSIKKFNFCFRFYFIEALRNIFYSSLLAPAPPLHTSACPVFGISRDCRLS